MGQVVELTRTDLRNPNVHRSSLVRQKRHEMAVAGHRSGLLQSRKVRDRLKSCVSDRVSPEVLGPLKPEAYADRHAAAATASWQDEPPSGQRGRFRRLRRWCRRVGRCCIVPIFLAALKIPAARPGIQLGSGRIDRANPVMQMPVDRHALPLLPALDCGHVAFEVNRDLLPRIQPVFRRSRGWRRTKGRFVHQALLDGWASDEPRDPKLYARHVEPRQTTAFDGKPRKRR